MKILKLENIDSTNNYAAKLLENNKISETTLIYTLSQTKGRGQSTNSWHSEDNKNLLLSLILFPDYVFEQHFELSMIISIAVINYLNKKNINAKIKWPNDIYVDNHKIAGILIENTIFGNKIKHTIVGIGLNLNQTSFPIEIPNPISLKNINSINYNIDHEVKYLANSILFDFDYYKLNKCSNLKDNYINKLYRFNEFHNYRIANLNKKASIIDVELDGHLVIKFLDDTQEKYYYKEIEYII